MSPAAVHPSLPFAQGQARKALQALPALAPAEAEDYLTKIIAGAMIKEHDVAKRYMCAKCQASYSVARRQIGDSS